MSDKLLQIRTTVTSVPVSSLNIVGWVLTLTVALQAVDESEIKQSRYDFSENFSTVTINTVVEKHWELKCPL